MPRCCWPLLCCALLVGCRQVPSGPPPPAPARRAAAPVAAVEPADLEALKLRLETALSRPGAERGPALRAVLVDFEGLLRSLPGSRARARVSTARNLLGGTASAPADELRGKLDDAISAAREPLQADGGYGYDALAAVRALDEAQIAVAIGRWRLAGIYLDQAAAAATVPPLQAAAEELREALRSDLGPGPACARFEEALHLATARGAVAQARRRAAALALGEARDALAQARGEVDLWCGAATDRKAAAAGLLSDLAGAQADLEAAAPGVDQRLEALWLKLGREPVVTPAEGAS
ncbi:MAG: hypothetical protein IT204_18145 [Fimbriimonadaceae bacterium]|nr:hypothetical protein [Fimbriimonadaceae bacterium]